MTIRPIFEHDKDTRPGLSSGIYKAGISRGHLHTSGFSGTRCGENETWALNQLISLKSRLIWFICAFSIFRFPCQYRHGAPGTDFRLMRGFWLRSICRSPLQTDLKSAASRKPMTFRWATLRQGSRAN